MVKVERNFHFGVLGISGKSKTVKGVRNLLEVPRIRPTQRRFTSSVSWCFRWENGKQELGRPLPLVCVSVCHSLIFNQAEFQGLPWRSIQWL